jgi:hypothetical protein
MHDCILKNYKSVSQKIFEGGEKVVCAWVLCKSLAIKKSEFIQVDLIGERIRYNPRVTPNWILDGENVDGMSVDKLVSVDFGVYKI